MSKEDRRRQIIEAATQEFAVGGYHGTPVEAIAKSVGVSQPYLFQLFGSKRDLFIAAVRRAFERTLGTFRAAAAAVDEEAGTEAVLMAMGESYRKLLVDRTLLMMQMQAYVACEDEEIRGVVRSEMMRLVTFVQSASGASDDLVCDWMAYGMMMNVAAAIDLPAVDARWARLLCPFDTVE